MKLNIYKQTAARLPRARMIDLFKRVVKNEGRPKWTSSVNVVFVSDAEMRDLNNQYRKKDSTTDVLSFVLDEPDEPDVVFGEIYISVPTARRQAVQYGTGYEGEYLRLFCHGLLHLFGYDHGNANDEAVMMKEQENYIRSAGRA